MSGRYEQIWLKSLLAMSNIKVFAMQDGWLAGHVIKTDYTDSYATHMDQKSNMDS